MGKIVIALSLILASCSSGNDRYLYPQVELGPVPGDADDCAIWVDPQDSSRSVVVGNDKTFAGGLYVWDLSGKLLSFVPMVRPINLDVRHGMPVGGESVDILAVGERVSRNVRIFKIDPMSRELIDITRDGGIPTGFANDIYGLTLYRQKETGKYYVFVSEKTKGTMIHQILLEDNGNGKVKGTVVRKFGGTVDHHSLTEGMCADDAAGWLYACSEREAVLKYYADAEKGDALVHSFARDDGIEGDREGIALYNCPDGTGYLFVSSQGNGQLKVYEREGQNKFLGTIYKKGSSHTDGIDATSCPAGPFRHGFLVSHHQDGRSFVIYDWDTLSHKIYKTCTCDAPE